MLQQSFRSNKAGVIIKELKKISYEKGMAYILLFKT